MIDISYPKTERRRKSQMPIATDRDHEPDRDQVVADLDRLEHRLIGDPLGLDAARRLRSPHFCPAQ